VRISPVVKKELASYFNSPIAYIVVIMDLVLASVLFFFWGNGFFLRNEATLREYFNFVPLIFAVIIPAVTMRAWAEERKSGTQEILLTLPFSETDVVLGKFLAALALVGIMLVLSIPLPFMLNRMGVFDAGQIICQYVGAIVVGACDIGLGLLISSLCLNQISAFLFALSALLILTKPDMVNVFSQGSLPAALSTALNAVSFSIHNGSFAKGVIDTRDLAYFVILCAVFLFLNKQVMVRRKWS
jgi:ABC-2 type transport system permease protein